MGSFSVSDVASKIDTPQISIGDMLNIARGAQAYKQAQEINPLAVQEAQQNVKRSTAEANVAEQTQEPRISASQSAAGSALSKLSNDQLETIHKHVDSVIHNSADLLQKDDLTTDDIVKRFTDLNKTFNGNDQSLQTALTGLPIEKNGKKPTVTQNKAFIAQMMAKTLDSKSALEAVLPSPEKVTTGAQTKFIQPGNPLLTGQQPGTQVGQAIQNEPGVTTTYVATSKDDPELTPGTSFIKLPNGEKRVTNQAPLDTAQQVAVSHDMAVTNDLAQNSQNRIGLYQGLKELSRTALVGPAADKRTLAVKVGSLFGLNLDPKTIQSMNDTDLFSKEAAMLGQLPGGTDAANLINQMANPNFKMMPESIREAADLGIAREKLNLLGQKIKSQYIKDPNGYYNAMQNFNSISDPRAYNFIELPKQEQKRMFNSLSLDAKGNPLPKGQDGYTNPQREFIEKTDKIVSLRKKYGQ